MKFYNMGDSIFTLNMEPVELKATEEELRLLYDAAYKGLRGDSLAIKMGYRPAAFKMLREVDPMIEVIILRAHADCEEAVSDGILNNAIVNNDLKAQIHLSTHRFGYMAAKPVEGEHQDIRIIIENSLPDPKLNTDPAPKPSPDTVINQ